MEPSFESTWELISGERFREWVSCNLDILRELVRLQLAEGDPVLQDLLDDFREDVDSLRLDWNQKLAVKAEVLAAGLVSR